jgi:mannose-6-phosphate isomerase-like protein (cupin superfamily)
MVEIRRFDQANLKPDNGLQAERLLPWPALNAPFEGSWCVVRPGAASGPHGHHEHEIWVAMNGTAEVVAGGARHPFTAGDIVHFPPGTRHQVVNRSDADFEMYAVWWDAEMAERFTARQKEESRDG